MLQQHHTGSTRAGSLVLVDNIAAGGSVTSVAREYHTTPLRSFVSPSTMMIVAPAALLIDDRTDAWGIGKVGMSAMRSVCCA